MSENIPNLEQQHKEKIINYYRIAQPFYRYFWHGKANGLHYGFWTEGITKRKEAITKENEVLADLAGIKSGDLVLDAGCGIGGSGIWLAEERRADVVGLNIVEKQLMMGEKLVKKRHLSGKASFVKGDYEALAFKDGSFDVFWSLESIEHATNLPKFMSEAFRVLKPGGRIIIAGTFLGNIQPNEEQKKQMLVGQEVAGCFNDFRTANENAQLMEKAGFINVQNLNKTEWVMQSAEQMAKMCRKLGVPAAKVLSPLHKNFQLILKNNLWGTYQEGLFRSGVTSYNILVATKPIQSA